MNKNIENNKLTLLRKYTKLIDKRDQTICEIYTEIDRLENEIYKIPQGLREDIKELKEFIDYFYYVFKENLKEKLKNCQEISWVELLSNNDE